MEQVKVGSLEMLGKDKKKCGTQQHQKARLDVLQRLRRVAELSPEQTSQWEFFYRFLGSGDGGCPWGGLGGTFCAIDPKGAQRPQRGAKQRVVCLHAQRDYPRFV